MDGRSNFLAVLFLGVCGILSLGGVIALAVMGRPAPQELVAVMGASWGALGGLATQREQQAAHPPQR